MNKKDLLAMNLQFFADDDYSADVNEAETVEQPEAEEAEAETQETESDIEEGLAEPQFQSDKANAAFANMRRELEAYRKQQQELDSMYAQNYGHLVNPETQQPIRGARDYYEALAAQERVNARMQMQQSGIDPSVIDNMIANSPAVRQAKEATAELNSIRAQQMMEADFNDVLRIDKSKTSKEDIIEDPSYTAVVDYVSTHPGTRFSEAYRIVNFDRLSSSNTAAARQSVVNQIKGQGHLTNGTGVTVTDPGEDIPAAMIENFKERFPDKSLKELKALYNRVIKSQKG